MRRTPTRLLSVAASLTLAACAGADNPLAPAESPAAPDASAAESTGPEFLTAIADQRIVFQSYRSGSGDIYKMDTKGYQLVRLTTSADEERVPAWSYDNKQIALQRPRPRGTTTVKDIYIINADGTGGHWATPLPSQWHLDDPSWSPDGSRLVVSAAVSGTSYLAWITLADGHIQFINSELGGVIGLEPRYDRAGQKIVYLGANATSVHQIKADGSSHKVLINASTYVRLPAYSPDGKKLAYSKLVSTGDEEIFVKNLVDGTTKRLTTSVGEDAAPSWSPDGSRIAFESRRSGTLQIWTMDAATGGSLTRITHTSGTELYPQWSH
jgi:Tol biopolymer transport system component